jgi:nucleotide-binding universal stress UspA family protein
MKNRQGEQQHRIVVGVDGFESSKAALRWAIRQAKLTGAAVDAVIAWHIPVGTGWIPTPDMPDYQEDASTVLAEAITEMCTVDPDVQVCPRVLEGRAGQVLVEAADGADLLVVGSEGHRGLAEALLGSVGQYCANHASCPVVVMRGKREG